MTSPPILTGEQLEQARRAALRARRARSALREAVGTGRTSIMQVLSSNDPAHKRMRVRDLLRSLPRVGPVRCSTIMDSVGIAPTKRVGGLTPRQQEALVELVGDDPMMLLASREDS